ncbi:MAG: hypothetical protein LBF82_03815 [Lactobacillales bacterium]|jgi:hypothetical protein|nr:hypothetical protein [Lactobacillales bacterium]
MTIRKYCALFCLTLSIFSVALSIVIPVINKEIGVILLNPIGIDYQGIYSVVGLVIGLTVYFLIAKKLGTKQVMINRLKLLLSFCFILSLLTQVIAHV